MSAPTLPSPTLPPPTLPTVALDFTLDPSLEAHEPPEARELRRDHVRLLVSPGLGEPIHSRFDELPRMLRAGDLLVVNTSATIPAALDGCRPNGEQVVVHLSTELPAGLWLVEVRRPVGDTTAPLVLDEPEVVALRDGGTAELVARHAGSQRLWVATLALGRPVLDYLAAHGRPIRYGYVPDEWPIDAYRSVFSVEPGSAEMPSASRPFTTEVVTDLVRRGISIAPLLLHTGVSSAELGEPPYPERYRVSRPTAALVNETRANGGRVIAVGTTVVRALATVTDDLDRVHPGEGWTERFVTPDEPTSVVDGLITGWHEPEATHLLMLQAIAGTEIVATAYRAAIESGYLWHEFGDVHLLLREGSRSPHGSRGS
jgi:S-adenosylmethionine:tRNA ribosyltransferase-isomerase